MSLLCLFKGPITRDFRFAFHRVGIVVLCKSLWFRPEHYLFAPRVNKRRVEPIKFAPIVVSPKNFRAQLFCGFKYPILRILLDYSDYQAFLFVGVGGNVVNLDAETYGAEIELQASPTDRLDLIVSASYVDAQVDDLPLRNGSPLPTRDVTPLTLQSFKPLQWRDILSH